MGRLRPSAVTTHPANSTASLPISESAAAFAASARAARAPHTAPLLSACTTGASLATTSATTSHLALTPFAASAAAAAREIQLRRSRLLPLVAIVERHEPDVHQRRQGGVPRLAALYPCRLWRTHVRWESGASAGRGGVIERDVASPLDRRRS